MDSIGHVNFAADPRNLEREFHESQTQIGSVNRPFANARLGENLKGYFEFVISVGVTFSVLKQAPYEVI